MAGHRRGVNSRRNYGNRWISARSRITHGIVICDNTTDQEGETGE